MRILAATLLVAACSNHVDADVTVNGEKVISDSCRSGALYGYRGVEITARSGLRLRISMTESGAAALALLPAGAPSATDLGACGRLTVADQHSSVDSVTNVEGRADLD